MHKTLLLLVSSALTLFAAGPDADFKATIVKHLTTSRDFTIKVAEAMPAADYDFKISPPQMTFGQQITHLSQGLGYFLSAFSGAKAGDAKPKSKDKADVVAFVRTSFDDAIAQVSKLTPEQLAKTYKGEGESGTGTDLLLGMLDHTTHHRASAEMYLRAKGIAPPEYQF
jgi:uncharacterized damage-inducible protein DinB